MQAFIERHIAAHHHGPTIGELVAAFRLSPTRIKDLIHQLADDHMIQHQPGVWRGISLPADLAERIAAANIVTEFAAHPLAALPCPKGQLSVMPPLVHIPDDFMAGDENGAEAA